MNHLRITIAVTDPSFQEILIAWLTELGYEGFEQQEDALLAYLPEESFDAAALEAVLAGHQGPAGAAARRRIAALGAGHEANGDRRGPQHVREDGERPPVPGPAQAAPAA